MTIDKYAVPLPASLEVIIPELRPTAEGAHAPVNEEYLELVLRDGHYVNHARVLGALLVHGPMSTTEAAGRAHVNPVTTRSALRDLRQRGNMVRVEQLWSPAEYSKPPVRRHVHYPIDLAATHEAAAKVCMLRHFEGVFGRADPELVRSVIRQAVIDAEIAADTP